MKIQSTKLLAVCLIILSGSFCLSCSKDKDNTPSKKTHEIQFKVITSAGSNIQLAVYAIDDDITSESSIAGNEWESELTLAPTGTKTVTLNAQGIGADESATMKVQIFVDGELTKEGTSKGEILVANATLDL